MGRINRNQSAADAANLLAEAITAALNERNTILESIGDAFFAVDKNWIVTYWNNTAEKVLMKSKNEMLGKNLWSIFSDSIGSESYKQYHKAIKTKRVVHFEDYYIPLNKWYEISAYPSGDGLSVYFKDITDRKFADSQLKTLNENLQKQGKELSISNAEIKESEKRYSELFHLSPLPMWVVDVNTLNFLDVNKATVDHYGYSRKEFLSMSLKDIRPAYDIPDLVRRMDQDKNHQQKLLTRETVHKLKNGTIRNVEIQIAPIKYQGVDANIVISTDITDRLNYIKAIEEQNERLKEISWMQSHIIRAPLARIMGLIPLITDSNTNNEEKITMLNYLTLSANELDEVIKNITDKISGADYKFPGE